MDASEPPGRLKTRVLFVCTGNICRSAFAEVAARSLFDGGRFAFSSAGTHAVRGDAATPRMQIMASEHELDLSTHRATPLDALGQPDVVFGMEQRHLNAARAQFPDLDASHIRLLDHPNAIVDPYGLDMRSYRTTARHIESALTALDLASFR